MKVVCLVMLAAVTAALCGCGPTVEEQHAMDQQRCGGFGFAPGTDAYAHCMMSVSQQREAQQAADQRAAADRYAADKRARDAAQAAQDKADRDAWDKRTGQGAYAHTTSVSNPPPVTPVTQGMNCSTTSTSTGSANNQTTTSRTICHN